MCCLVQDMIDEYSKFRGTLYNVEGGKKGTGVTYQDVAGVEHAMELVEETIEMLLGDPRYLEIGAHTPRVGCFLHCPSSVLH